MIYNIIAINTYYVLTLMEMYFDIADDLVMVVFLRVFNASADFFS